MVFCISQSIQFNTMYSVHGWAGQAVEKKKPISNDKTRFGPKDPCLLPTNCRKLREVPRCHSSEEWRLILTSQGCCDDLLEQHGLKCLPLCPGHGKISKELIAPEVRRTHKHNAEL